MSISATLAKKLNLLEPQLYSFCVNAPKKYKVYSIPKRSMGKRIIAQPTSKLKDIQRSTLHILIPFLNVHNSAYAYKVGVSIKDNAIAHKDNTYFLKMDFQNFFNKIKPDLFLNKLRIKMPGLSSNDEELLTKIFFWKPGLKRSKTLILSVGAPSSPYISNFVMFDFDSEIDSICSGMGIKYTRYADDLTFSTNKKDILFQLPKLIRNLLSKTMPSLTINDTKTVFSSKAHNRHVTGVTISNDGELSLGRKKKKHLSSLIYKYSMNNISSTELSFLRGMLSHAKHIEPDFILRMKKKYGIELVKRIVSGDANE